MNGTDVIVIPVQDTDSSSSEDVSDEENVALQNTPKATTSVTTFELFNKNKNNNTITTLIQKDTDSIDKVTATTSLVKVPRMKLDSAKTRQSAFTTISQPVQNAKSGTSTVQEIYGRRKKRRKKKKQKFRIPRSHSNKVSAKDINIKNITPKTNCEDKTTAEEKAGVKQQSTKIRVKSRVASAPVTTLNRRSSLQRQVTTAKLKLDTLPKEGNKSSNSTYELNSTQIIRKPDAFINTNAISADQNTLHKNIYSRHSWHKPPIQSTYSKESKRVVPSSIAFAKEGEHFKYQNKTEHETASLVNLKSRSMVFLPSNEDTLKTSPSLFQTQFSAPNGVISNKRSSVTKNDDEGIKTAVSTYMNSPQCTASVKSNLLLHREILNPRYIPIAPDVDNTRINSATLLTQSDSNIVTLSHHKLPITNGDNDYKPKSILKAQIRDFSLSFARNSERKKSVSFNILQ